MGFNAAVIKQQISSWVNKLSNHKGKQRGAGLESKIVNCGISPLGMWRTKVIVFQNESETHSQTPIVLLWYEVIMLLFSGTAFLTTVGNVDTFKSKLKAFGEILFIIIHNYISFTFSCVWVCVSVICVLLGWELGWVLDRYCGVVVFFIFQTILYKKWFS